MNELLSDMRQTLEELNKHDDVNLAAFVKRFEPALASGEAATQWMLEQNDASLPAATSVEYLMMQGRLAGAWMMARLALAAYAQLSDDGADRDYLSSKMVLARYYAERMLPLVEAAETIITDSASTTIALDQAML